MNRPSRILIESAIYLALVSCTQSARADYIVDNSQTSVARVYDNGSRVFYTTPLPPGNYGVEEAGASAAVTPDFKTVYEFTNSLGYSDIVFAFDAATRQYLPNQNLYIPFGNPPLPSDSSFFTPGMPLIRPSDPFHRGDLFGINNPACVPTDVACLAPAAIKRVNRSTGVVTEAIHPPTSQLIYDFNFGPDNRLYMAGRDGIFVYSESATGFHAVSPTPLIGTTTGNITFGPDGNLYVRDSLTGNIDRYSTTGSFLGTFIPESMIPEITTSVYGWGPLRGSIQFGVDGNLHIRIGYSGQGLAELASGIGKYDGLTGAPISFLNWRIQDHFFPEGRITYVPAPEASSIVLAITGTAVVAVWRRRRKS